MAAPKPPDRLEADPNADVGAGVAETEPPIRIGADPNADVRAGVAEPKPEPPDRPEADPNADVRAGVAEPKPAPNGLDSPNADGRGEVAGLPKIEPSGGSEAGPEVAIGALLASEEVAALNKDGGCFVGSTAWSLNFWNGLSSVAVGPC